MQEISFSRSQGFFTSNDINIPINIIGVGATGSYILMILNTFNIMNPIHIYDQDNVESHNPVNQYYFPHQIGKSKVEASKENASNLNVIPHNEWYKEQNLQGFTFILVDTMEERRKIVEKISIMPVEGIIETRLGITTGAVYSFPNYSFNIKKWFSESDYDASETDNHEDTCGARTSIAPTVITLASYSVIQFIQLYKGIIRQEENPSFRVSFNLSNNQK